MERERISIPMVIGGKEIETKETTQAVMPHRKEHVLADVAKGGPEHVQLAIDAAREAHADWSRLPWEERAAVYLRAAELLAGPWRSTLVAATMLNQSKTAHQAEIDAAAELVDFWRFNVEFMLRIYAEQPVSSPGVWNRMEYRPLEGFVFAVSPFNFTAIGGNLSGSPALMGNTVVWKPASTAALSAHYTLQAAAGGRPPRRRHQPRLRRRARRSATPRSRARSSPGSTSPARRPSSRACGRPSATNIASYRNYPRIVGETGGKDFILAHPSADVDAVATAIVRGSFEYQGQKCSAASRVYAPKSMWPELRERLEAQVAELKMGDVADFSNFMGAVIDGSSFKTQKEAIDEARASAKAEVVAGGGYDDARGLLRRADRDRDGRSRLPDDAARSSSARSSRPTSTTTSAGPTRSSSSTRARSTRSPARSSPTTATPSRRRTRRSATPPATSTSTTSRPAPSSASSRSAARARPARTTRPARCGT